MQNLDLKNQHQSSLRGLLGRLETSRVGRVKGEGEGDEYDQSPSYARMEIE
jgi:hypothetical protein